VSASSGMEGQYLIDYEALLTLIRGLEVVHYDDGHQVLSRELGTGMTVDIEESDGEAVIYQRRWDQACDLDTETELGRFPVSAVGDIAARVHEAEQEYRS
jgi:hypothetical protein